MMKKQIQDALRDFHNGTLSVAHAYFGCHEEYVDREYIYTFRTFFRGCDTVYLASDLTGWGKGQEMQPIGDGVYETSIRSASSLAGQAYKFRIVKDGVSTYCADPFAFMCEAGGGRASLIAADSSYAFRDEGWLLYRKNIAPVQAARPMNVYEVDLGAFMSKKVATSTSYSALAEKLIPYAKHMGYTHILLLSPYETVDDAVSLLAPRSFFGSPNDFRYFISAAHAAGLGVLLDSIPVGYDLTEPEARSLLLSSWFYFADAYHADGYILHSYRCCGVWNTAHGGNTVIPDMQMLLKEMIADLRAEHEDIILISDLEDAGAFFYDAKEARALIDCLKKTKKQQLPSLLPSRTTFFSLSQDTLSSGSGTLLSSIDGNYDERFSVFRLAMLYMMTAPQKKLLAMGNEFASFRASSADMPLEWFLLDFPSHRDIRDYTRALNHFYLAHRTLWEKATETEAMIFEREVLRFRRTASSGRYLQILLSFSDKVCEHLPVDTECSAFTALFSTHPEMGHGERIAVLDRDSGRTLDLKLPPLCGVILAPIDKCI